MFSFNIISFTNFASSHTIVGADEKTRARHTCAHDVLMRTRALLQYRFDGRVRWLPFPDHLPPTLRQMRQFCYRLGPKSSPLTCTFDSSGDHHNLHELSSEIRYDGCFAAVEINYFQLPLIRECNEFSSPFHILHKLKFLYESKKETIESPYFMMCLSFLSSRPFLTFARTACSAACLAGSTSIQRTLQPFTAGLQSPVHTQSPRSVAGILNLNFSFSGLNL